MSFNTINEISNKNNNNYNNSKKDNKMKISKPIVKEILSFFSDINLLKILKHNLEFRKEFYLDNPKIDNYKNVISIDIKINVSEKELDDNLDELSIQPEFFDDEHYDGFFGDKVLKDENFSDNDK